MYLQNLSLINFKNYPQAEIGFSPRINCFVGNNGVGKTNLLDAIHYLSLTKSYFNAIDTQNIRHDNEFFVIQGSFQGEEHAEDIYCSVHRSKKKQFKRNKKEYTKLADHIGLIPVVMISPADGSLIIEGSDERRKFIDSVISQYDHMYLDDLIRYNRALVQRNVLLKNLAKQPAEEDDSLALWDEQMIPLGERIFKKRQDFIERLIPLFQHTYDFVSLSQEKVRLRYVSQLADGDFRTLLLQSRLKDKILQYSSAGVHKDDLWLGLDEYPIKRVGSQGQQKTFLVALKLAEFGFIREVCGHHPLLLLDDVFDKFDNIRVKQIIQLVARENFGQIFITDTNLDHLEGILAEIKIEHKIFRINDTIEELREV
jgi:DNA replication and repair protein RecF